MESACSSRSSGDIRCGPCLAERAPYTCPRCHLRFCSVPCYRAHGACARDFQSRELQLRLRGQRGDEASRRRLKEALLRLQELREPKDAGLPLGLGPCEAKDQAGLWGRLSPGQRKHFQRLLSTGEIAAFLPRWEPWWEAAAGGGRGGGAALVQELPPSPPAEHKPCQGAPASRPPGAVPAVPASIPPLSALRRSPPSPLLRFQLPNVLFGYVYALALYHGQAGGEEEEAGELLRDFCGTVLDVSAALGARRVFRSAGEALQGALQALEGGRYPECQLGNAAVMAAVARILLGEGPAKPKRYSLAALAHLARLLDEGKRRAPAEERPALARAQKKCRFLLSWANENEPELAPLALEVRREWQAHRGAAAEVGALARELERSWGAKVPPPQKPLIEELD
ncbi:zinc finger HIT domain-containing protein 2 [Rhineura floridana]|uniref:zinc finger HIT domain-containing protein 2 n=1 Tax=Rhineura floridana TaxID=261503 RepID=UPI002AC7E70C|nr:zinc finger HIT domain-containing protein 2 [Rhineura floridana]